MERKDMVTLNDEAVTLIGNEIKIDEQVPDFRVLDKDLKEVSLENFKGKTKLIATVPSLDTPVCDLEIKRFNDEAAKTSKDLIIIFISMDLPFAQKRFCQEYNIKKVKTFSDYKEADFGQNYGVLIKELRLLARAIFIVDKDNILKYAEYVNEITSPPNYEAALKALEGLK
ncbi:thiol peroxidase [Patescibacteria group bacterium]|nr:thiol peroxidase [Patescibacteria group bacterium]